MSVVTTLVAFGVRSLINAPAATAVKLTADRIEKWYADHTRILPDAIERANDRAWRSLAVALGGDGLIGQITRLFASGSDMAIREQVAGFLHSTAHELSHSPVEFRKECLAELKRAGKERALAAGRIAPEDLSNRVADFQCFSDPHALVDSAWVAAGEISDSLAAYPKLATLLRQRTPAGSPLLVTAFAFFFRREVETNAELARGLAFDGMRQLSTAQETGFRQLEDALSAIGPRFDELFDKLDAIEEHVLDIKEEMRRMHATHAGLLTDIISQLNRQGMAGGAVRANQSFSIRTDSERRIVKDMLARFRQLPVNTQEQLPATLNGLGKLMIGAGDFVAAEGAFEEVARSAHDPGEKAEAYFNAYRAALEQKKWPTALEAIEKAAELDARQYALFPRSRYQAKAILGAGGFGAAFLCVDQFMQADVVVKSLHDGDFDRSADEVFAEARILRKMRHPAIVSVLDTNFADPANRARPYIVMDHFEGGSLETYLREHGELPVADLLEIAVQVADGMKAAHDHGILHRDLKPDNILVRQQNGRWHVCIIDFGLALHRDPTGGDASSMDKSILGGSVAGTMKYAPPEQQGELPGIKPGTWSDVYTFGKTCCYALFRTTEPRMRHLEKIPVPLRDLLERCIEQELEHRIKDFGEVIERMRACRVPADPIRPVRPQVPNAEEPKRKRENRGYDVFMKLLERPVKREDVIAGMVKEGYSAATAASYISWSKRVVDEEYNNPFYFEVESYKDDDGEMWLRKKPGRDFTDVDMDVVPFEDWVGK
jgi:serine/threonine protein kinase